MTANYLDRWKENNREYLLESYKDYYKNHKENRGDKDDQ